MTSVLPSGVTFVDGTGALSVSNQAAVSVTGTYTITATGTGNYKGFKEVDVDITVNRKALGAVTGFSISGTKTVTALTGGSATATVAGGLTHTSDYTLSISPNASGNIIINNAGAITIGAGITVNDDGNYTITATGQGDYIGTKTGTFTLTVDKIPLAANDFSFQNTATATALTAERISDIVTSTSLTAGTDYSLAITNWPGNANAVSIDNDGTISIDAGITVSDDGDYTITATGQDNYSGMVTGTFNLTVDPKALTANILGVINNPSADFEVSAGITNNHIRTLIFDGTLTRGTDFSLSLVGIPQNAVGGRVSLSPTGLLTIDKNVVPDDSGTYTINAIGNNNYDGTVVLSLDITVNKIGIIGTLGYADLEVGTGQTKKSNAFWNGAAAKQTVRYTLISQPSGISIVENNGVVTVDASVVTADTTLTIRAEGTGLYTGEKTATLSIFIRNWIPSSASLTYSNIRASIGSSETRSPQWAGGSYDVEYRMVPLDGGTLPNGININPSSGNITVSSSAAAQADTVYQVTATGIGSWKGWKKAEISISVYDSFYYEFQPALVGQTFSLSPINASSFGQFTPDSSLPSGLTLDSSSGEISGIPTTRQLAAEYTIEATPTGGGTAVAVKVSLFIQEQATDKNHLWQMIDEEITAQGSTADLGLIDTSSITDMSYLFDSDSKESNDDYSAFNGDISSWDVSNVTTMNNMFNGANSFNGDISSWNVSMVSNMYGMFWNATAFNGDLSNWDVSRVNKMDNMFYDADSFNGDISTWNVSNVLNMHSLFWGADSFNGDISAWNVSNVTTMNNMFYEAKSFNGDISGWDVSRVTNMSSMFREAAAFNGDLSGWNVSSVTDMNLMFSSAAAFNGNLSSWNVSSVTDMTYMFSGAAAFNGNISGWNVSSVTNMYYMFYGAAAFNGDLSGWNVSSVTDMSYMFYGAAAFNGNLSNWNVISVTSMNSMFRNTILFNSDLSGWNVSNVTDMSLMFWYAESFNGNISGWNVSSVTNMSYMFSGAAAFNGNLSNWNVTSVTSMKSMFENAKLFNSDLSNWDVSNVTDMSSMFRYAESFNGNISGWNVSSVTNMTNMFFSASSFSVNLEPWSTTLKNDVTTDSMFEESGLASNPPSWYQP